MMVAPTLTIQLFGPLRVFVRGEPMPRVRTRSAEWLLALLVLRHGREVDRTWLAGTLWPESEESQALQNLRTALMSLRKALGSESGRIKSPTRDLLTLDLHGAEVDVVRFDSAMRAGDDDSLTSAVEAYTGPLLEGCYAEWAFSEREMRSRQCLEALETLADRAQERLDHGESIRFLHRAEALDPLRDTTTRRLMTALDATGDPGAAVAAYRRLRQRMLDELSTSPDEATSLLFRDIRTRAKQKSSNQSQGAASPIEARSVPESSRGSIHRPPHPLTSLFGRDMEVEEIREQLAQNRLVTLIGAGGIGKTRLAIEVAVRAEKEPEGGSVWLELAPIMDGALILTTLGVALGVREAAGDFEALKSQIISQLSRDEYLLVLDNCEHLLDEAAKVVMMLMSSSPSLRVLATSRQRFGLTGEVAWRVPSLPVADVEKLPMDPADALAAALAFPAVRLFIERAASAQTGFQLARREEVEAVCRICERLDGIPLAIELAAARVRTLSVEDINLRLDQRFRLLIGGSRAALPRQQTLRSLIDWSYDLLDEAEKSLLCRLSVFAGGCTLKAAEQICCGGSVDDFEILDLVTSLMDKSLVVADQSSGSMRYILLETVRQYARDRLLESGKGGQWRHRHLAHFLALAEEAAPHLAGAEQHKWLEMLEAEHDNLRMALEWSSAAGGDTESGLRLVGAIWRFWHVHSHFAEGRRWFSCFLDTGARGKARAIALSGAGSMALVQGDYSAAFGLYEEGLAIQRELGDRSGVASTLNNLGIIAGDQSDYAAARALHEESLAIRRELGEQWGIAASLNNLGWIAGSQCDYPAERALYEEALVINRALGNRAWEAINLGNLGSAAQVRGDYLEARALHEESLAIVQELGNRAGIAFSLEGIASAAAISDPARAARIWGAAERLREEIGSPIPPGDRPQYDQQVAVART